MWEEWRAEIDRSLRDAQLTESRWYERELRSDLDPTPAEKTSRLFSIDTLRAARREVPRSWRMRIAEARLRPIL